MSVILGDEERNVDGQGREGGGLSATAKIAALMFVAFVLCSIHTGLQAEKLSLFEFVDAEFAEPLTPPEPSCAAAGTIYDHSDEQPLVGLEVGHVPVWAALDD
jgi:hypothetical protein